METVTGQEPDANQEFFELLNRMLRAAVADLEAVGELYASPHSRIRREDDPHLLNMPQSR